MSNLTNKQVLEILKELRHFEEGVKEKSTVDLAEMLAQITYMQDTLKVALESIKEEIDKRKDFEDVMFPELNRKVILADKNDSTNYFTESIYNHFLKEKKIGVFFQITKVQAGLLKEIDVKDKAAVEKLSEVIPGKGKNISVRKMNKAELAEAQKVI